MHGDNVVEVVLGVFGKPNRNGDTYVISKSELTKAMEKRFGKPVGEIGQSQLHDQGIVRMTQIDPTNSAGTLMSYAISEVDGVTTVTGKVALSPRLLEDVVLAPERGHFGIRALTQPPKGDDKTIRAIDIISFDYLTPGER